jgi:succinate dehydrogenase/fumarate reductase cytochrome b subunit
MRHHTRPHNGKFAQSFQSFSWPKKWHDQKPHFMETFDGALNLLTGSIMNLNWTIISWFIYSHGKNGISRIFIDMRTKSLCFQQWIRYNTMYIWSPGILLWFVLLNSQLDCWDKLNGSYTYRRRRGVRESP